MVGSVYSESFDQIVSDSDNLGMRGRKRSQNLMDESVNIKIMQVTEATQVNNEEELTVGDAQTAKELQTFEVRSTQNSRIS